MTTTHTTRAGRDVARGFGATLALLAFVVGIPAALVALAPVYLPDGAPGWGQLWDQVTSPDDGSLLLLVLAAVAWITWAAFSAAVVVELAASARRLRAPSIPLLGGFQRTASRLIATAGLLLATATSLTAPAAPAAASALVVPVDPPTPAPAAHTAEPASPSTQAAPAATTSAPQINQLPSITVRRGDTLWDIAEHHLGDPLRYTEIRDLNLGRTQPDGRQLRDADWILPGWVLLLPADATDVEHAASVGHAVPAATTRTTDDATIVVKPGDTLWDIAADHLGDGHRYPKIADLNHGVSQPDGARLTDPDLIRPGWVLRLPGGTPTVTELPPQSDAAATTEPTEPTTTTNPTTITPPPSQPTVAPHEAAAPPAVEATPTLAAAADDTPVLDDLTDEADEARPTSTWFLGFAALGAVGIVGEIARRRHLQQRARKVGETIPLPEPTSPAAAAERALRAATTPVSIDAIRATLVSLAHRCFDAGRDLPRIGALLLDEHHLTLLLLDDAPDPVAPFSAPEPRTWVAATTDVAAGQLVDDPSQANPYPLLVVLGHTDEATVILPHAAAGTLAIVGDETAAGDAVRALVMETATSDLASQLAIHVDEPLANLEGAFEDFRLRTTDAHDDRTRIEADIAAGLAAAGHDDTLQLRGDGDAADLWLPYVYVEHTLHAAPSAPWSGVVTITRQPTDAAWMIQVTAHGEARLEPLGIDYQPQRLTTEHAEQLRTVLVTSLPPEPRRTPREPTTTRAEDAAVLALANPPAPPREDDEPQVSIDVLGPIEFRGLPATAKRLTPRMKELLVYLALHGPTTGADLEDVLWEGERVQHGTRATLAYRTRDRVGKDVLPKASDDGVFQLGPMVTTDWARFQRLISNALANHGEERIDRLTQALALVRDRPFRGIGGGQFPWADYDIQQMTSAIADATHLLARLLHESGQHREALDAAMRGLAIEPFSEPLQQQALAATEAVAGPEAARQLRHRLAEGMARLDPELA